MNDTDKYEGHTPAPWDKLSEYCPVGSIDKQLIADAPKLLAEVKRMRTVFDSHGECHLCGFRLDEHYPDHELPCDHVEEGLV